MIRFLPTLLTLSRFVVIPFIVQTICAGQWRLSLFLFLCAAATDVLDGFLARLFSATSFVGSVLDPLADKALILSCLYAFSSLATPLVVVPQWIFWMLLLKEIILVTGIAALMVNYSVMVAPSLAGKAAMGMQVLFMFWLFSCYVLRRSPGAVEWYAMTGLLVATALLALGSYGVRVKALLGVR